MSSYLDKREGFNLNKPLNKLVKGGRAKEQKGKMGWDYCEAFHTDGKKRQR